MNDVRKYVYIDSKAKIEIREGVLSVQRESDTKEFGLGEIGCLFLVNPNCSITTSSILACAKEGVPLVALDEKHRPAVQLLPFYGSSRSTGALLEQKGWTESRKKEAVVRLLKNKLAVQAACLKRLNKKVVPILESQEDPLLVEGPAAKAYFHALFGKSFTRSAESVINSKLNYGYAILASTISMEIVSHGYATQIGIHHASDTNPFNLSYDLIEPWRPVVDCIIVNQPDSELTYVLKTKLTAEILSFQLRLDDRVYQLRDALSVFVQECLKYLCGKATRIPEVSF